MSSNEKYETKVISNLNLLSNFKNKRNIFSLKFNHFKSHVNYNIYNKYMRSRKLEWGFQQFL